MAGEFQSYDALLPYEGCRDCRSRPVGKTDTASRLQGRKSRRMVSPGLAREGTAVCRELLRTG